MSVVRLSSSLYKRLSKHAKGFETPSQVIERLLDAYENKLENQSVDSVSENLSLKTPSLTFVPDEESFRKSLVKASSAKVILTYHSGEVEERNWQTANFKETSNLRGNIWSGCLRGWKDTGIVSAEFHAGP